MRSEHNVTNMRNLILILLLFWGEVAHSQLFIQKDEALWKTHKMMSKNKLSAIGLYANTDDNLKQANLSMFLAKEEKTNKWGVMTNLEGGDYFNCRFILSPIYDSITELAPDSDVLFLRKNNTFGFVYIFEDVEFFENGIPKEIDFFDEVKIDIEDVKKTAYVRKGGKWGVYRYYENRFIFPCIYNSIEEVPKIPEAVSETQSLHYYYFGKKKFGIVGYWEDPMGDNVYYGCDSIGKRGLFQMDKEIIPMKYDSILPMSFNAPFVIVYNEGKAGIYTEPFGQTKMSVECAYDELIRFKRNGMYYCAARKGENWAILDWYTGELLTDFDYRSYETISVPRIIKSAFYN